MTFGERLTISSSLNAITDFSVWTVLPAGLHALRRALGSAHQPSDQQLKGLVTVSLQDLQWALSVVKPSAMREVAIDVPKVQLTFSKHCYLSFCPSCVSLFLKLKLLLQFSKKIRTWVYFSCFYFLKTMREHAAALFDPILQDLQEEAGYFKSLIPMVRTQERLLAPWDGSSSPGKVLVVEMGWTKGCLQLFRSGNKRKNIKIKWKSDDFQAKKNDSCSSWILPKCVCALWWVNAAEEWRNAAFLEQTPRASQ